METILNIKYYLYYLESSFLEFPLIMRITVFILMVLISIYTVCIIRCIVVNRTITREEKQKDKISRLIQESIKSIFTCEKELSEIEIQKILDKKLNNSNKSTHKIALTQLIIEYVKELIESNQVINEINYKNTLYVYELPEFWEKELNSNKSNKRHEALRRLDELGSGFSGPILLKSAYDKDNDLRKHARAAVLRYDDHMPFKFLDENFDHHFTTFDELRIHHFLISRLESGELPLLTRWVKNSNQIKFKIFMIREIGLLRQKECAEGLFQILITEENIGIKSAIIETLGKLNYQEVEDYLIENYFDSFSNVQLMSIQTIAQFGSDRGLDFLSKQFNKATDNEQKVALAYALKLYGKKGSEEMSNLFNKSNEFEKKIIQQVNYQIN